MKYEIYEFSANTFMIYRITPNNMTVIKTFKTRKGAENWIKRNA